MQARAERHAAQGFVQFVGAGPGDPELITLRGWRALHSADVVLHDALVDRALVDGIPGVRVDVGKRCGRHAMLQAEICELLVDLAFSIPHYNASTTVILLMARNTASTWRQQLLDLGYPSDLPVALISKGCTPEAQVVETTVAGAAEDLERASLETPLLAVIGWVVTLRQRLEACIGPNPPLDSARCLESPLSAFTPRDTRSTGIR